MRTLDSPPPFDEQSFPEHSTNEHSTNEHSTNGHATNGHTVDPPLVDEHTVDAPATGHAATAAGRRTWWVIGGAAVLSALLRLRMVWVPVSVDEGGYLAIARAWGHGSVLYRDVFVDRPQGLLLLFRFWDWVSGGNTESIRIMAMLFGALLVVSMAVVVREVAGHSAARYAAVICAVVSAAPILEGYSANAELLSGGVAAAGLAVGVLATRKTHRWVWFYSSGLLAGMSLSLKQSGFDGLLAIGAWLILAMLFERQHRRMAIRGVFAICAGLATIIAALVVHGAATGWARWWAAVVGYRLKTQSAFASADWHNLVVTAPYAGIVLGAAALLSVNGAAIGSRRFAFRPGDTEGQHRSAIVGPMVLVFWLASATCSFLIGGGFWRHYWMLLAAPISALAGIGLAALPRPRIPLLFAVIAPSLAVTAWVYSGDTAQIPVRAAADHRSVQDDHVGQWFRHHRTAGQNLYVLCSSAGVYADAHQDPGYPYLWNVEVHHGANAQNLLVDYLSDPIRAPTFIAQYQSARSCDDSGRVAKIMHDDYQQVTVVDSVAMFERIRPVGQ